jgi:hypothetical protein
VVDTYFVVEPVAVHGNRKGEPGDQDAFDHHCVRLAPAAKLGALSNGRGSASQNTTMLAQED